MNRYVISTTNNPVTKFKYHIEIREENQGVINSEVQSSQSYTSYYASTFHHANSYVKEAKSDAFGILKLEPRYVLTSVIKPIPSISGHISPMTYTEPELYIFSRDDELLTILTESNGLISAPFRDELNRTPDTPLEITVDAQVEYVQSYADGSYGKQLTQVASMYIGAYGVGDTSEKVNVSPAQFVKEDNSVVFKDREGKLREYVIKEKVGS